MGTAAGVGYVIMQSLEREGIDMLLSSHDVHDVSHLRDRFTATHDGMRVTTCRAATVPDGEPDTVVTGTLPTAGADVDTPREPPEA